MSLLNSTQVPNKLIEAIYEDEFTEQEIKVLLFICRRTIGWHQETQWVTRDYIEKCLPKIWKSDVSRLLKSLEEKGAIDRTPALDRPGGWYVNLNEKRWGIIDSEGGGRESLPQKEKISTHTIKERNNILGENKFSQGDVIRVPDHEPMGTPSKRDVSYRKVFELWGVYPLNWRKNRTEVEAAKNLLEERGLEKAKKALKFHERHKKVMGCPKIVKPSDLDRKWADLVYFKENL